MVNFRFFHASLAVFVVKEGEDLIERLPAIIEHVGKRSALPIFEEIFSCDPHIRHCPLLCIFRETIGPYTNHAIAKCAPTKIVSRHLFFCQRKNGVPGYLPSQRHANVSPPGSSNTGIKMLIRCEKITSTTEAMEIELRVHSDENRQFVTDRYAEWGYSVVSVGDAPVGIPKGIIVRVSGNDRDGIIDRMCNSPDFDVKC
jgi:hypothetical protein